MGRELSVRGLQLSVRYVHSIGRAFVGSAVAATRLK